MKSRHSMTAKQLGELVQFVEEHPGFSPRLTGEDAILCGFEMGECVLSLEQMEQLFLTPRNARLRMLLAASAEREGGL